jgi:hypothetical protein
MPVEGDGNLHEILELRKSELRLAQARHVAAARKYWQIADDYKQGVFATPDGSLALQQAQREESAALQEYMRALRIFTDLLLRRPSPP